MNEHERAPFQPDAYRKLVEAEGRNWWFLARNRILMWVLRNIVGPFDDYLEIGCGTGFVIDGVSKEFPEARLRGSEYYEEGLEHARARVPSAEFVQLDARNMDMHGECSVIGAFDVLEHIEEDDQVVSNVREALKPGGSFVVTVPQHRWLWSIADEHACHVRRYSRKELRHLMRSNGLDEVFITSFVSLLLPLMWFARLTQKEKNYDPMSEFNIPNWMNDILGLVMKVEFFLIRKGLHFPFGGSLLVVARKPAA